MSVEIGAAGDIATGMLVARAVEPRAGEAAHSGSAHGLCLNCGTALLGDFCHACGQIGHIHRTLTSIGHDLLHGVFHFEGKIWRTLPMLVTHPGALTRRYIAGERARFVSPLALFLFTVFLMFAVIHSSMGEFEAPESNSPQRAQAVAQIDREIAKTQAKIDHSTRQPGGPAVADLVAEKEVLSQLKNTRSALGGGNRFTFTDVKTGWHAFDKGIAKANANPGLALYKLQSSAYKYSWALIPISVPFMALLFLWRRRFKLYDHAIFVTYSLSFMMLLVVLLTVCSMLNAPSWISGLLLFAPPVHMFFQLRGAYSLRKRSALWRTAALLIFSIFALLTFATLLLVLGMLD